MHCIRLMMIAAALVATLTAGAEAPLYSFPVIGDLHYDSLSHHDMEWVTQNMSKDLRQIENYSKVTATHTPALLQSVAAAVDAQTGEVPFWLQLGDFGEGLCGSRELQATQFREALAAVKAVTASPFLPVRGNHDVTGPGAYPAGDDVLLPHLRATLGDPELNYNFTLRHQEDLFIFFESMKPDVDWLRQALESNPGRRNVFLVTHYPVLPYNYRSHWGMLAQRPALAQARGELLELLEKHRVIILSAHLHLLSLVDRRTENGHVVQMSVSSVINRPDSVPRKVIEGVSAYTGELALERDADLPNIDFRKQLLEENRPSVTTFYRAEHDGFAMLHVYADRVEMSVYNITDRSPVKELRIR